MKLKSCMTLFDCVEDDSIFNDVLEKYFNGNRDFKSQYQLNKKYPQ